MKLPTNTPPPRDAHALAQHFSATYFALRVGLAALAFAFAPLLYGWGKLVHGLDLQPSMSAYFWAAATVEQCAAFPMRTIFVGFLFAIGVGLYLYKGLTELENVLLNVAGVCAALVALVPERLSLDDGGLQPLFDVCPAVAQWAQAPSLPIHYAAAIALFVLLAFVAWACACKSLDYLPVGHDAERYRRRYRAIAIAMLLFPLPGMAVAYVLGLWSHWLFFVEAAGIVTFGAYWALKSRELALSRLEREPEEAVRHAAERASRGGAEGEGAGAPPTVPQR